MVFPGDQIFKILEDYKLGWLIEDKSAEGKANKVLNKNFEFVLTLLCKLLKNDDPLIEMVKTSIEIICELYDKTAESFSADNNKSQNLEFLLHLDPGIDQESQG